MTFFQICNTQILTHESLIVNILDSITSVEVDEICIQNTVVDTIAATTVL